MEKETELWLFIGFELAGFLVALGLYVWSHRRARSTRRRLVRTVRIVAGYSLLILYYYGAGFTLRPGYTAFGFIFYGVWIAALHVMLLAAVLLFTRILLMGFEE